MKIRSIAIAAVVTSVLVLTASARADRGSLASLPFPGPVVSLSTDAQGNLYALGSDPSGANHLWQMNAGGQVSELVPGQLNLVAGLAADAAGNVYVLATRVPLGPSNQMTITKIAHDTWTPTLFATLSTGYYSLAVDGAGRVYTLNRDQGAVFRVGQDGTLTQVCGALAGPHPDTTTWYPYEIASDAAGNIAVTIGASRGTTLLTVSPYRCTLSGNPPAPVNSIVDSGPYGTQIAADPSGDLYYEYPPSSVRLVSPGHLTDEMLPITPSQPTFPSDAIAADQDRDVYVASGRNSSDVRVLPVTPTQLNVYPQQRLYAHEFGTLVTEADSARGLPIAGYYQQPITITDTAGWISGQPGAFVAGVSLTTLRPGDAGSRDTVTITTGGLTTTTDLYAAARPPRATSESAPVRSPVPGLSTCSFCRFSADPLGRLRHLVALI